MRRWFIIVPVIALNGCATMPERVAVTASGRPEAFFPGATSDAVSGKIAEQCLNREGLIEQANAQLVCSRAVNGTDALLADLLIGNAYSTPPVLKVRFAMITVDGGIRVQAFQWIETQTAFGQTRTIELNSNRQFNSVQEMFVEIGGKLPDGAVDTTAVSSLAQCDGKQGNNYRTCYNAYARGQNRAASEGHPQ